LEFNKDLLFKLSTATLIGFALLGIGIIYFFQGLKPAEVLLGGEMWYWQLTTGLGLGIVSAGIAVGVIKSKLLSEVSAKYHHMFSGLDLSLEDIVYYSFCASVGEEIFFRAGIQPYLGIWLTAIVFIALHGYINPFDWRTSIYGVLMVFVTAGMGYLFQYQGLFSAICAHFIFDVLMFYYLLNISKK